MEIPLFEVEDMKTGRGGGKKGGGKKYAKYDDAVKPHVDFLKKGIAGSKDGSIRVRVEDLSKAMGMTGKHETSIYWGLKFVLFQKDIVVTTGQTKNNEAVLVMKTRKEGDTLPASLAKYLGTAGETVEEVTGEETLGEEEAADEAEE